jgi:transposase
VRLQAAEWFAEGVEPPEVARRLRVSCNSAYAWRRRWRAGGKAALASRGPGGAVCRLGGAQLARLRAALEAGPAVWGWAEDQRWTLERVAAVIGRLFHVSYTVRGTSYLLHRLGFSPQVPVHRAAERDEDAIAAWRAVTWGRVGCTARSRIPVCADTGLFRAASLRTRRAAFTAPGSPAIYAACATGFAWM